MIISKDQRHLTANSQHSCPAYSKGEHVVQRLDQTSDTTVVYDMWDTAVRWNLTNLVITRT